MLTPFGAPPPPPVGVAFDVPELVFLRAWAEGRGFRLEIALDHIGVEGEYEEVAMLYARGAQLAFLTLWRSTDMVVLDRQSGRPERFSCLSEALEGAAVSAGRQDR